VHLHLGTVEPSHWLLELPPLAVVAVFAFLLGLVTLGMVGSSLCQQALHLRALAQSAGEPCLSWVALLQQVLVGQ